MNRELEHTHKQGELTQTTIDNTKYNAQQSADEKYAHAFTQMRKKTYDNDNKNIALFKRSRSGAGWGILYIKRAKMFLIIVEMRSALKHNYPKWMV